MKLGMVKLGDELAISGPYGGQTIRKVIRITKTQIVCDDGEYITGAPKEIRVMIDSGRVVGSGSGFLQRYATLPTDELRETLIFNERFGKVRDALRGVSVTRDNLPIVEKFLAELEAAKNAE